jgi:hypothetical protein
VETSGVELCGYGLEICKLEVCAQVGKMGTLRFAHQGRELVSVYEVFESLQDVLRGVKGGD